MRRDQRLGTRAALLVGLFVLSACSSGSEPAATTPYDPDNPPDRVTTTIVPTTTVAENTTVDPAARRAELTEIVADHLHQSFTALYESDAGAFRATLFDDFAWDNIDGDSALEADLGLSGSPSRPDVTLGTIHIDQPDCFVADIEFKIPERSQADVWPGVTIRQTTTNTWTRAARNRQWRCDAEPRPEVATICRERDPQSGTRHCSSEDEEQLRAAHGFDDRVYYRSTDEQLLLQETVELQGWRSNRCSDRVAAWSSQTHASSPT